MSTLDQNPVDGSDEPPSAVLLAGEYVLGMQDADVRRQLRLRRESDPGFARLVDFWERQFTSLVDEVESVRVPEYLWPRIRTQVGWTPVGPARKSGAWNSVAFWRGAAALAAAAAIAAVFLARAPQTPAPVPQPVVQQAAPQPVEQPKPVVELARDDGTAGWLASIDAAHGKLMMVPVPAAADAQGRVPELWLIPAGGSPRSLGIVSINKAHSVSVPDRFATELVKGSTLAITLEPPGGAPRGVPTGPIIAKGAIQTI